MPDLTVCLKKLLERLLTTEFSDDVDQFLSKEDILELLEDSSDINDDHPRENIVGYPTRPLYCELGNMLQQWCNSGVCPILQLPSYDLLDEKDYVHNRAKVIEEISPQLECLSSLIRDDEVIVTLHKLIKHLGRRGLLDLIGVRKTVGSIDIWPPPRKTLENTFQQRHSPETASVLTVGARALTKHAHRDLSSSWWGVCTGSEQAKNDHATSVVQKILDNATWINIHSLPKDIKVIEARQENGYGVRWSADGKQFRGFLEPQMIDGHEVGWRH